MFFDPAGLESKPNSDFHQLLLASLASFPPVLGADRLAELLDKSVVTILADRSRAPHKLPPAIYAPGAQKPIWLLADVVAWLLQYREEPSQAQQPAQPAPKTSGAPRKAERVEAARLGITVRELRARKGGAA